MSRSLKRGISGLPSLEDSPLFDWRVQLGLFFLAVLPYLNSFPGAFVQDDTVIVLNNPLVSAPDLITIFRTEYWHGVDNNGLYRPLTILSLALNRMMFGPEFWGYHLVNILLHAGVSIMFWRVLLRWNFPALMCGLSAALFAVHPIHVEAVDLIVGRSESLSVFFLLTALWFGREPGRRPPFFVCSSFLLALLAKENAITFLAIMPVFDLFSSGSMQVWRKRWPLYVGLALTAGLWLLWREVGLLVTLPPSVLSPVAVPLAYVPWWTRVLTGLQLQWLYLGKLLMPVDLQATYAKSDLPPFVDTAFSLPGVVVISGVALATTLVVYGWKRRNPCALFALIYVIAFTPTSNLFFALGVSFAERLAYFPSLWFCAGVGTFLSGVIHKEGLIWTGRIVAGSYLLLLIVFCLLRNPDFSSEVNLYSAEVQQNPLDVLSWLNLAEGYNNAGLYEKADLAYQKVFTLEADFAGALRSRTAFLMGRERLNEAYGVASRSLALARQLGDRLGEAVDLVNLGSICLQLGKYEEALGWLNQAAQLYGSEEAGRYEGFRGMALAALNRYPEAVAAFSRIPEDQVGGSEIPYEFATLLYKLGHLDKARAQLELALRSHETAQAWNLLGVIQARQGESKAAAEAFSRAVSLDSRNLYYQENLQRARQMPGVPSGQH